MLHPTQLVNSALFDYTIVIFTFVQLVKIKLLHLYSFISQLLQSTSWTIFVIEYWLCKSRFTFYAYDILMLDLYVIVVSVTDVITTSSHD